MVDVLTKKQRSYNMSRIRSKWTTPEKKIHNYLKGYKIKHKMHPKIDGNPDVILLESRAALLLYGCFWHKCSKHFKMPDTRKEFWSKKIESNVKRDKKSVRILESHGWKVIRIWEHEIKEDIYKCLEKIESIANK